MAKKSQKLSKTENGITIETTITLIQSSVHYQATQQIIVGGKKLSPQTISGNIPPIMKQISNDQEFADALSSLPTGDQLFADIVDHIEKTRYVE